MIILLALILLLICIFCALKNSYERFDNLLEVGKLTNNCYNKSRNECMQYANCGLCNSGGQKCVPGDSSGPYFNLDCKNWTYLNKYDRYEFDQDYLITVPSFDYWPDKQIPDVPSWTFG